MSGPCDTFSAKAFQYFCIHVCDDIRKLICGQMHLCLRYLLASGFSCADVWKTSLESQNGKRSRSQTCPTFILNLSCPRSCYDLTFEPSKTSVEFRDWLPILRFIEQAVTHFWGSYGDSFGHIADGSCKNDMWKENKEFVAEGDFQANYTIAKKRCRSRNHQASLGSASPQPKLLTEECGQVSAWRESRISCRKSHRNAFESKECLSEVGSVCHTDYLFESCDASPTQDSALINQESNDHLWTSKNNILCAEDNLLDNKFFATGRYNKQMGDILSSRWNDVSPSVDANMSSGLMGGASDYFAIGDNVEGVNEALKRPFLRSCSSQGSKLLPDATSFVSDEGFDFQIGDFRNKPNQLDHDDRVDIGEADNGNLCIESMTLWKHQTANDSSSPGLTTECDMHSASDSFPRNSRRLLSIAGECFGKENDLLPDAVAQTPKLCSRHRSFSPEWSPLTYDPLFGTNPQDIEHSTNEEVFQRCFSYDESGQHDYLADRAENNFHTSLKCSGRGNCSLSSCMDVLSDCQDYAPSEGDICEFQGHHLDDFLFPKYSGSFTDQRDWFCFDSCSKDNTYSCAVPSKDVPLSISVDKNKNQRLHSRCQHKIYDGKKRSIRSHSAPPFYRAKKKIVSLNNCSTIEEGKFNSKIINDAPTLRGACELNHPQELTSVCDLSSKSSNVDVPLFHMRFEAKRPPDEIEIQNFKVQNNSCFHSYDMYTVTGPSHPSDLTSKEDEDPLDSRLKWRNSYPHTTHGDKSQNIHDRDTILDISSGILHLASNLLIPKSINRKCLEDAKVLRQVDKKFIPVVAGGTLAIIDQHAADERIRLEELRHKVLSGEMRTITYLDAEQELVLPEIGQQLLHNYAEQIQNWGWICNFHAQDSRSFKKSLNLLHSQPTVATLVGVPCILGVNLTDVDLLEFLQQLADTDGSSTIPPSVLRILNCKACRGAIMFGDTLLPSECSLIVEELRQTSLCFQCAHGRPTTIPLINLDVLHKQIAKLGLCSNEMWHGLRRHEISLQRAEQRLSSTGGQC
ncbi:unnamed protein product [Ilex paraguariensis]|uniref:MutL C-terminal dimerisation domain-containing protein n=1 Tax=Ilex paraguariensis TaxID=185542 RepID=A0ABC8V0X3_9AQUA